MEHRLTPKFFYGSAIAALIGLLFGVMLHAGWEQHPGGPRILFSTAQAAEVVPSDPGNYAESATTSDQVELVEQDDGPVTPDPLPVTRLAPEMFEVQPATADETGRQAVGDVVTDDAPQAPPRDFD